MDSDEHISLDDQRSYDDLFRKELPPDGFAGLKRLKSLNIRSCKTEECLVYAPATTIVFPVLEELYFLWLSNLRQICRGPVPEGSFGKLTSIDIRRCHSLKYLFPLQIVGCLTQLKRLTIQRCAEMKEVIWKEQGDTHIATNGIEFRNLEFLHLADLPSLVGFCTGIDQIDFSKLRCMDLEGFSERLFDIKSSLSSNSKQNFDVGKQISDSSNASSIFPQKVTFPCLEDLSLEGLRCEGYSELQISLFLTVKTLVVNSSMARHLVHLKELNISNCSKMDAIVDWEEEIEDGQERKVDTTLFPQLSKLQLNHPSNLKWLCRGPVPGGSFGELTSIEISQCNSLEYLFPLQIVGCLTQLKLLTIQRCAKMEEVIWKEQGDAHIATNGIEFRNLEFLHLADLPNLVGFCTGIDEIDFPKLRCMHLNEVSKRLFDIKSSLPSNSEQNAFSISPQKVTFPCLEDLTLEWLRKGYSELQISPLLTVKKLVVKFCSSLGYVFNSSMARHLVHLKELNISNCSEMYAIVDCEEEIEDGQERKVDTTLFPQLSKLQLNDLSKLRRLCRGPVPGGSFGELTSVEIGDCNNLENLFQLGCLTQLKRLTIQRCDTMKEVIWKEQGDAHIATNGIEFRNLEFLDLGYLPNLMGFCTGIDQIDFPKLRCMHLRNLQRIKGLFDIKSSLSSNSEQNFDVGFPSLFPQKVTFPCLEDLILRGFHNWGDKYFSELLISSFPTVKKLEVSFFHGSRYVFHSSLAGHLVHLKELNISNCGDVEAVFRREDEIEDGQERNVATTLFPQLRKLQLNDLRNLKRFCHFTHTLELPMLSKLDIRQCPSMKEFSLSMTVPNLSLRGISWNRGRNPDI